VNFGSAAAFDPLNTTILTVNGDYTGNGGTLAMRTVLGDDASPTDLLVITGTASGNTNVTVENIGGPGALTNNGILLIDVGAVSPNDQFILLGTSADDPNAVDAGAFRYHLIEDGDDWFLRSESIFRPEVPLVTALPGLLAQGNLNILGNLHQRMGDDMNDMQNDDRLWMRVLGGGSVRQNQENIASPQASGSDYGVQAGFDVFQNRNEQGQRNDVGFYAAYLKSRYDITGTTNPAQPASRAGVLRPETKAVGAYWTYKDNANTGFYSDLVFQYSRYGGNGESVSGASARIGGSGLLGSLEVGYGMPMNEHWSIQPQAQIVAQRSNIKDISLPNATVRFDDKLSLASRLGLRLVGDYITDSGRQWKPYARANYWHGFGGKRTTSFENLGESTPVQTQLGYDSLELGAGFTVALTRNVNLYAELDHVFAMGKASRKLSNGLAGSVGIRVLFGAEPPPPVVAAPPPAPLVVEPPAPPPPAPPTRITLSADALFDFDSAQLRPAGRDSLSALVNGLRGMNYEMLILGGHTDRFGTDAYNQSLSERRVNTVRDYLIKNGIPADGVRAVGYGESQPVTTMEQCPPSMSREALIVCLQPDRRVEVEVQNLFNP
jgi:outer membrane autotransporter protein